MINVKRNFITSCLLTISMATCSTFPAMASDMGAGGKISPDFIPCFTVMNVDEEGAILQQTKDELGDIVRNSGVKITDVTGNYPEVSISGLVSVEDEVKPFNIEGEIKNCGETNKNRLLLEGTDTYGNFEIMDCSFYNTSEWLNLFNKDIPDWKNKSINTLYLLDKENRNFTFCETVAEGEILEKEKSFIAEKDELNTADIKNINWIGKILKVVNTSLKEPNPIEERRSMIAERSSGGPQYAQSNAPYSYSKDFTYLGNRYRDTLNFNLMTTFSNNLPLGGITSGEARIQCLGGLFKNLDTGDKTNSNTVLGRADDIVIDLHIEEENKHGFVRTETTGLYGSTPGGLQVDISYGISIPKTGIGASLSWKKGTSSSNVNANCTSFYNNASDNQFSRNIKVRFDKNFRLHYSDHYLQTNFQIRDFDGSRPRYGKVTAFYNLAFYNNFDGSTDSKRIGRTVRYSNQ